MWTGLPPSLKSGVWVEFVRQLFLSPGCRTGRCDTSEKAAGDCRTPRRFRAAIFGLRMILADAER